ncbi:MAG: 30S ribosomal protein S8 [Candidatus Levybacteria bacterium]|nr:30S ribosomal protein S8 [Candidatus Levybacteria bacterium]
MNHTVSDFLTRIKNASMARRREVTLPYSNITKEIGKVLVKEGFLQEIKEAKKDNRRSLHAVIAYEKRSPRLSDAVMVSKPSLRVYKTSKTISDIERRGKHKVILTTSQGVMTGKDARKKGIGGEILFEIW